jgi:hypothetical protein
MTILKCVGQVLVFLESLKEATNAVGNFLPNEIEMKIFDKFVMLSLQLQDM